jgi:hypothetical protein
MINNTEAPTIGTYFCSNTHSKDTRGVEIRPESNYIFQISHFSLAAGSKLRENYFLRPQEMKNIKHGPRPERL